MKKIFLGLFLIFGLTIGLLNVNLKAEGETFTFNYNINKDGTRTSVAYPFGVTYGQTVSIDAGTQVDYEYVGYFKYTGTLAVGDYGKVNPVLNIEPSIRVTENTSLDLFYKPSGKVAVILMDANHDYLGVSYTDGASSYLITEPSTSTADPKANLSPVGWTVDGVNLINFASQTFTSDTIITVKYNVTDSTLKTLAITNGTATNVTTGMTDYHFNDVVTVLANGTGTFDYWLKDGVIASIEESYTFTVAKDHLLEAVYDSGFVKDSDLFVGVSEIYEDLNTGYATIVGQIDLPEGEELVEWGIITSQMTGGITHDTPDVKVFNSNKVNETTNEFVLSFTKAASYPNYRAFVKTINTTTSVVTTTYSYIQDFETLYTYASDLFISEYLEGSSSNKAIEIFNGTNADIDLSEYKLVQYNNGSPSVSYTLNLSGIIARNKTYVIVNDSASEPLKGIADFLSNSSVLGFNGDDAIALVKIGTPDTLIDVIGRIGVDPGTAWGTAPIRTAEYTLVRKSSINYGDSDGSNVFDPSIEWTSHPQDTFDYMGSHTMNYNPVDIPVIIDSSYTPSSIIITGNSSVNAGESLSLSSTEEVVWFSSNTDILTIDQNGLVSGKAEGSATVYAYSYYNHSVYASHTITVSEAQEYTVSFNSLGGSAVSSQLITGGEYATEPSDPTRSDYVFDGWYTSSDNGLTLDTLFNFSTTSITSSITLYAKWLEEFIVTFETNGGTPVPSSQVVVEGSYATEPEVPTKDGYEFGGWYEDDVTFANEFIFTTETITSDKTIYVKWITPGTISTILRQSDFGTTNGWSAYTLQSNKNINNGVDDPVYPGTSVWTILGGNVNTTGWDYIRMGGKSASSELNPQVYLETEFKFLNYEVTSIVINIIALDSASETEIIHLQTSINGDHWTTIDSKDILSIGDLIFESLNISSGNYFRFVFERASTGSNVGTDVKTITFYGLPE